MITRREVVAGGLLSSAFQTNRSSRDSAAADDQVARVLGEIRDDLRKWRNPCDGSGCPAIESIRLQQRTYLKGQGKFPDYIDVGIDVWERIMDWHVTNRLPIQASRMADGRYAMPFQLTTLVLRHDMSPTYIGLGYEK